MAAASADSHFEAFQRTPAEQFYLAWPLIGRFFLGYCLAPRLVLARALRLAPVARIGAVSYGVYLFHLFAMHAVGRAGEFAPLLAQPVLRFLGTLALSVAIAEVSYRWFESRFLRLKARLAPSGER